MKKNFVEVECRRVNHDYRNSAASSQLFLLTASFSVSG